MPYKSQKQAAYFHAHKAELEAQGVDIAEWDAASKGNKLPKRAPSEKHHVLVKALMRKDK